MNAHIHYHLHRSRNIKNSIPIAIDVPAIFSQFWVSNVFALKIVSVKAFLVNRWLISRDRDQTLIHALQLH